MRIAVFARPPIPGRCKTRLARAVGAARAAELYAAFVADTLRVIRSVPALEPELHVTEERDHPFFTSLRARFELPPPRLQFAGHLGERMGRALDVGVPTLLVGTDAPTLPASILRAAQRALDAHDVVLSPASDGGYVLIGSAGRHPTDFLLAPTIRWSSRHALADTVRAAPHRVALTAPWYDVDEPADLALLRAHLALDPRAAPATAAALFDQ